MNAERRAVDKLVRRSHRYFRISCRAVYIKEWISIYAVFPEEVLDETNTIAVYSNINLN